MAKDHSSSAHSASDKKLDQASQSDDSEKTGTQASGQGQGHDAAHIREHSDTGKDRLFEDRQQHDEAEKNSEKTRLARDVRRHGHEVDDNVADAGSGASAKRKS